MRGWIARLRSHRELQLVSKPSSACGLSVNALCKEEGRVPLITKHERECRPTRLTGTHHIFSSLCLSSEGNPNLIELFLLSLSITCYLRIFQAPGVGWCTRSSMRKPSLLQAVGMSALLWRVNQECRGKCQTVGQARKTACKDFTRKCSQEI